MPPASPTEIDALFIDGGSFPVDDVEWDTIEAETYGGETGRVLRVVTNVFDDPLPAFDSIVDVRADRFRLGPFRVIGIEELRGTYDTADGSQTFHFPGTKIRLTLSEVRDRLEYRDNKAVLHRTVYDVVLGRLRHHALLRLLEAKGILSMDEYSAEFERVVRSSFVTFASEVVPEKDAEAMLELIVARQSEQDSLGVNASQAQTA